MLSSKTVPRCEMKGVMRRGGEIPCVPTQRGPLPHLCAAPGLYILSSIYLHSSYNVSMTTRKWLAFQNEEGSNACALPCGIGGFGWGVRQVGNDGKWPVPRPTQMPTLHLPGGSKFDPPGSTHCWCCLSLPKLSAGNGEQGTVPLK